MRFRLAHLVMAGAAVAVLGCCGPGTVERPYSEPAAEDLVRQIQATHEEARSFRAKTVMDYWTGRERVKGTVWIMGERGAKIRFNALNPTGNNVAVDLACDGRDFYYLNFNEDCQLTGPCTADSIARLLRVSFEPDDFLLLAMGTTPLLERAEAALRWDGQRGLEVLTLRAGGWTQEIELRAAEGAWDVVGSVVTDPQGEVDWRLENRDFSTMEGEGGTRFRVPGRSRFRQPKDEADLIVRWDERVMNLDIDQDKYQMEIPAGLPTCE